MQLLPPHHGQIKTLRVIDKRSINELFHIYFTSVQLFSTSHATVSELLQQTLLGWIFKLQQNLDDSCSSCKLTAKAIEMVGEGQWRRTRASGEAAGRLNESRDAHFARPNWRACSQAITGEFGNERLTKIEIKHQAVPFLWPRKHFQRNFPPALLLKSYFCSK